MRKNKKVITKNISDVRMGKYLFKTPYGTYRLRCKGVSINFDKFKDACAMRKALVNAQ